MRKDASYSSLTVRRLQSSRRLLAIIMAATAIGWFVGLLTMILMLPLLLFPPFLLVTFIVAVPLGVMLALPVTAFLLPAAAAMGDRFNASQRLILPVIGMLGGGAITTLVFTKGQFWLAGQNHWRFIVAGALAGLAAGWFFARRWPKGP